MIQSENKLIHIDINAQEMISDCRSQALGFIKKWM